MIDNFLCQCCEQEQERVTQYAGGTFTVQWSGGWAGLSLHKKWGTREAAGHGFAFHSYCTFYTNIVLHSPFYLLLYILHKYSATFPPILSTHST